MPFYLMLSIIDRCKSQPKKFTEAQYGQHKCVVLSESEGGSTEKIGKASCQHTGSSFWLLAWVWIIRVHCPALLKRVRVPVKLLCFGPDWLAVVPADVNSKERH